MSESIFYLDVDEITLDPDQPRKTFYEDDLKLLALTMEAQDIINPIEVDDENVIVTGTRRWKAAVIAGKKKVPCTRWNGAPEARFERQVIENLNHNTLTSMEREDAIVKLWETGKYPTMDDLAKNIGLSLSRISTTLSASRFRQSQPSVSAAEVSTRSITETSGLETEQRVKILEAVSEGKINPSELREIKEVAKSSEALLDKVLTGEISVDRAKDVSETINRVEAQGVTLEPKQKQRLVDRVAKDEKTLEEYEGDVLERVEKIMTTPKDEREILTTPIGRTNPVTYIVKVKDEIKANFRKHIGNCDVGERRWALRVLTEIQEEIEYLIGVVSK